MVKCPISSFKNKHIFKISIFNWKNWKFSQKQMYLRALFYIFIGKFLFIAESVVCFVSVSFLFICKTFLDKFNTHSKQPKNKNKKYLASKTFNFCTLIKLRISFLTGKKCCRRNKITKRLDFNEMITQWLECLWKITF